MKITRSQLKEIIREEIKSLSESKPFKDSWRGVTKKDAIELAKKNNLKFVQDKKNTRYWWAFRPGAKQAIFKWDEEWDELISDYSPLELRYKKIKEEVEPLEESTFVAAYNGKQGVFAHEFKAKDLKDALQKFVRMYRIPESDMDNVKIKQTNKSIFRYFFK